MKIGSRPSSEEPTDAGPLHDQARDQVPATRTNISRARAPEIRRSDGLYALTQTRCLLERLGEDAGDGVLNSDCDCWGL